MNKAKVYNEYNISFNHAKPAGMNTIPNRQKSISGRDENNKGISVFLQYGTRTNFREYDLQVPILPGFDEYEIVGRDPNKKSFNKAASVQEYIIDLNNNSNFYVEPFDDTIITEQKNTPAKLILQQPANFACPSPGIEKPTNPGAAAIEGTNIPAAALWNQNRTSGNEQTNKLLNAISQIESAPSTGDEINDGFLEDMKTILADPKIARQQSSQQLTPTAQPTKEEDIFDRIAKNMQYANQYDFGTFELEKRFDEFDKQEDRKLKTPVKSNSKPAGNGEYLGSVAVPVDLNSSDFLEDLDLINMSGSQSAPIPLDPGVGGRSILPEVLEAGDIILSTTTGLISSTIRSATGSEVSHASVYVGGGKVIHATEAGVQEWSLDQLMDACSLCVAYHHRDINDIKAAKLVQFLRTALDHHTAFDGWGLIHAAPSQLMASYCDSLTGSAKQVCLNTARNIKPGTDNSDQFFCSELIFAGLKEAGLTISTVQPSFSSPQEAVRLFYDGTLQYVGHLKV